jgi:hypothetical protein
MKVKILVEIVADIPDEKIDNECHMAIAQQLVNMLYVYDQPESNDYCDFKDMNVRSIIKL